MFQTKKLGVATETVGCQNSGGDQVLSGSLDLHHGIQFQYLCLELFVQRLREETSNIMLTKKLASHSKAC